MIRYINDTMYMTASPPKALITGDVFPTIAYIKLDNIYADKGDSRKYLMNFFTRELSSPVSNFVHFIYDGENTNWLNIKAII